MRIKGLMLGCWLLLAPMVMMAGAKKPALLNTFTIPIFDEPPVIDGIFDEKEWERSAGFDGFTTATGSNKRNLEERRARSYIGASRDAFYFCLISELPQGKGADLVAKVKKDIFDVVFDDSYEIWVDLHPEQKKSSQYQALFNYHGKGIYTTHSINGGEVVEDWNGAYEMANQKTKDHWVTEVRVPIASFAANRQTTEGTWGLSLCRNWKQPWAQTSSPGGFRGRNTRFKFVETLLPLVRHHHKTDPHSRNIDTALLVNNPTDRAFELDLHLDLSRNTMYNLRENKSVTVQPGETATLDFKHKEDNSDAFGLMSKVSTKDGQVLFERHVQWGKTRKKRWSTIVIEKMPVDFQFAHYPTRRKVRMVLDVSGLPKDAELESLVVQLRKRWESEVLVEQQVRKVDAKGKARISFETPELEGVYELSVKPLGKNAPDYATTKTFVRDRYEWEGSKSGLSQKVYAPFTDIQVKGDRLNTVLREHDLNDLGLMDQIVAAEEAILSAPMRYHTVVDGKKAELKSRGITFEIVQAHEVKTAATFTTGVLSGESKSTWDYDGAVKIDLTLYPTGGKTVNEFVLEIPLKDEHASLLHAMSSGIRQAPLSTFMPKGQGRIWGSDELIEGKMPKGFATYVYVGSPKRGLSWFAENDLNWGWDRKTPNVELVRSGKTLVMRVHLINRDLVIEEPRKITFGLLAAPVKPRMDGWRTFSTPQKPLTLLGTSINWLAGPGICGNLYPAGKNPKLWKLIARANREEVSKKEIDQVIKETVDMFKPWERDKTWVNHVRHNLGATRRGKKMVFYFNRAVTNLDEEYDTFFDEWLIPEMKGHDIRRSPSEQKIVPSRSYGDFAMHWYRKSFEYGNNTGVYWDNFYVHPSYNLEMTDAYLETNADGEEEIIPAAGIWGLRDIVKRTFVMMNEEGMEPFTFPHMTSASILPLLAFATAQLDWEWKYSTGDVQYRHDRAYLQVASTGELAGVVPRGLWEHGKQKEDEWTQRTFAGVALVHEVQTSGVGNVWSTLRNPLYELWEKPELKAWRYWDEGPQPVLTSHPDVHAVVYALPGKLTRVVLCSYAEEEVNLNMSIDLDMLGLGSDAKCINYETGEVLPLAGGRLPLTLVKHGVFGLEFSK